MVQKTVVELIDDIDGKPADESILFGLDGVAYNIDLSARNAAKLRKSLAAFVEKARKAGPGKASRSPRGGGAHLASSRARSMEIRAWAKQQGIPINDRGRIPTHVVEAYEGNDTGKTKTPAKKVVPQTTFRAVSNP